MWAAEDQCVIKQKSQGAGLMVSDFVDEHDGYLRLTEEQAKRFPQIPKEARVIFKYGQSDGYWNNERFLHQMESAIGIWLM